jgi:hypothetical protein
MKIFFMIIAGIVVIALLVFVVVPLGILWYVNLAGDTTLPASPTLGPESLQAAKGQIFDACSALVRDAVHDPAKSDQVKYACNCVVKEMEPQLPGRTVAEIMSMTSHLEDGAADLLEKCARQVGLVPAP